MFADAVAVGAALRRLAAIKTYDDVPALAFPNCACEFTVVVRPAEDDDDDDDQRQHVCVSVHAAAPSLYDDADDADDVTRRVVLRALDLEVAAGTVGLPRARHNEDDELVSKMYDVRVVPYDFEAEGPATEELMETMNAVHAYRLCPCQKQLIKDGRSECVMCDMVGGERAKCVICFGSSPITNMRRLSCCAAAISHPSCMEEWLCKSRTCPMCRAPQPNI